MIARVLLILSLALGAGIARAEVDIQEVTSPGGLKAWLVEEPAIPFVALELRFRGGASLDLPGKRGATNLMVGLLEEGAGEMDATAFAERTEALAAQFSFDVGDDVLAVSAKFLTETQAESVDLLRQALVAPRFDDKAVERVRAQVQAGLRADAMDPDAMARRVFDAQVFGSHPYGSPLDGTPESVAALTRDDLVDALHNAIARDRVYIAATGDIDATELGDLLDTLLGDLPATGGDLPEPPEVVTVGGTEVVPFDTPQSVCLFGQEGIDRDDPDFFAAYVLNQILGGSGFEARLMDEVREKRGLTYGIGSYLVSKDQADIYVGRVASANDRIAEAIEVIRAEWARMAEDGPTEAELARTKTYMTGAYPLRFDGNGPIAKILVGMQMQGLSPDYVNTRNAKIEAVTLEDTRRVAKRLLQPENLRFVVVGQPVGL